MPVPEAGTITVTVATLNDQSISSTALTRSPLGDDLPPLTSSPVINLEIKADNSLKSNTLTECTQYDVTDSENYPQDGHLARANTVTSVGKPEVVSGCLDVAAFMSRLQNDLKEDDTWEREEADEEDFGEREGEAEEGRKIENMWTEREKAVKGGQKTAHSQVSLGILDSEQPNTEPKPEPKHLFDTSTRTTVSDKGKGLAVGPPPVLEGSRKLPIIPKFERGTGPAPGEGKYTSKKMRPKKSNGFRLFGFGSSSRIGGDNGDRSPSGLDLVQQKSRAHGVTEDKQEEKMKAFLKAEYASKKAALSKAKLQLSEATSSVRALENLIQSIEKRMLSKGIEISGNDEKKRTKTLG